MTNPVPIPCAHCGTNFMRHDLSYEAPKLCNNCSHRESQKNKEVKNMCDITILIECDRQTQIEIEEICVNEGISFSKYFLDLHKLNTQNGWISKDNPKETLLEEQDQAKRGKPSKKS